MQNGTFVDRHAHNLSSVFIFSRGRRKHDGYDVTMRVSLSPVGPSFATSKMASENGSASDIRDSWIESTMRVFIQSILITALLEVLSIAFSWVMKASMQVIMHTKCSLKQRDIRSLCVGVTHMCVLNLLDRLSGCKQHCIWHVLWRVVFVRVKGYRTTRLALPPRILTMQSNRSVHVYDVPCWYTHC